MKNRCMLVAEYVFSFVNEYSFNFLRLVDDIPGI